MTKSQTLSVRLSEIRQRLNEISGLEGDAFTDEIRQESDRLTREHADKETAYRAAITTEAGEAEHRAAELANGSGVEPPEVRERREIRNRTGLRDYLAAACSGAPVTGAAAEFNEACGVKAGDHVPLEMFDGPARELRHARRGAEHRAITPGPTVDAPAMPTIPFLFERAVVSTLGLDYPSVSSGVQQVPAITTAPPASVLAKGGAAPSTAGAYSLTSRSPKRLSGQIEFRVEDLAVHPALDSDLSMSLQSSMSNQLDEEAFNGGGGNDLSGLLHQASDVSATGTTDTFALALAAFAALVDGRYARGMNDLRAVVGSATFAAYMALYHGGSGDMTVFEKLQSLMGSLVVSDRMPAVASGAQKGVVTRNAGGQPIRIYTWNALQLVRDPYSGAGSGKVTVTGSSSCPTRSFRTAPIRWSKSTATCRKQMRDEIRCAVEIREGVDGSSSPGRLVGTLLTYGERAADRAELFEPGALMWPANGVVLRRQHVREAPIARVIPELRGNALVIDAPLPDTAAGRDAAAEIRAGLFGGLSVEFNAQRERRAGGVRRIAAGVLVGAGLVDSPSYAGSRVEVRKRREGRRRLWL